LDGDGKPDITLANYGPERVSIFRNQMGETLPLTLLNFSGELIKKETQLHWQTTSEQNTAFFNIERATGNMQFNTIGKVAAAGTSSITKSYSFIDANPLPGTNYYRLKMVDADGKFTYSKTIVINNDAGNAFSVYPNPAKNYITVQHPVTSSANIQMSDMQGKIVKTVSAKTNATQTQVEVKGLAAGTYTVTWSDGKQTFSKKLVVE
jgi:hypothetical protein